MRKYAMNDQVKFIKGILLFHLLFSGCLMWGNSADTTGSQRNNKLEINVGAELVSRYVWRGIVLDLHPQIQPVIALNYGNFCFDLWGSQSLNSSYSEIDLGLHYTAGWFTFTFYDYYAVDENFLAESSFFRYKSTDSLPTNHTLEASVDVKPLVNIPLNFKAACFFYGADLDTEGKVQYSTYLELSYQKILKEVELNFILGGTVNQGFYAEKAAVTNVAVKAIHWLNLGEKYKMAISASVILNPDTEDVFFIFGLATPVKL